MIRRSLPKILMCGHGRSGKDTACEYLAKITLLRNAGTTSKYLCKEVARRLGLSEDEAYQRRHESNEMRTKWYDTGNEARAKGPTTLIRQALEHGEISGGIRAYEEIIACRKEGLVDLIVWIQNDRVPTDPTVKFSSKECDIIIENNGTLEKFYERLSRLARFANLPMRDLVWNESEIPANSLPIIFNKDYPLEYVDADGVTKITYPGEEMYKNLTGR